jgi:exopolysaccharide production protein ExoZ
LEALRAGAAIAVLAGHALDYAAVRHDFARALAFGADLFFVLSGYIVSLSAARAASAGEFLWRRAQRIVPLYALVTILEALRRRAAAGQWPADQLAASLLFWPHGEGPLIPVGWTLNFEAGFYLWLAAVIAWRPRGFAGWAAVGPLVAGAVNPIWWLFTAGCLLRPLPGWCGVAGLLWWAAGAWAGIGSIWDCTLTVWGGNSWARVAYWGGPAVLLVGAAAGMAERPVPAWLLYLGRESYAIYLFQYFGLMAAAKLFSQGGSGYGWGLALALSALLFSLGAHAGLRWTASMMKKYVARIHPGWWRPVRMRT